MFSVPGVRVQVFRKVFSVPSGYNDEVPGSIGRELKILNSLSRILKP